MRYTILDGFRGFFLLFMGIIHINRITDVNLGKLNHHYFGWVEDAQGFVFISGIVVGLVYGGILIRKSARDMQIAIFKRVRTIYSHQAALIFIFLSASAMTGLYSNVPEVLKPYSEGSVYFTIMSLALITGSLDMGILPMYIWFMMATPLFLRIFNARCFVPVFLLCISVWFVAQTGLLGVFRGEVISTANNLGLNLQIGFFFNVFAWQLLFFGGLFLGFKLAKRELDLNFLHEKQYFVAFCIGFVFFIFFGILDRVVFDFWISNHFSQRFLEMTSRQNLSVIYVLNFALDLFLATWLIIAGPACGVKVIESFSNIIHWLFTRRFLVFLGQHSLHVFSYHLVLVYAISAIFEGYKINELEGSFILIAGAGSLYIPAWLHARIQAREREKLMMSEAKLK